MKLQDPNTAGRAEYRKMWDVTAGVVKSWDPYGLLGSGAPGDEFDREIASLVAQIPRIHSELDAAHAISRTFAASLLAEIAIFDVVHQHTSWTRLTLGVLITGLNRGSNGSIHHSAGVILSARSMRSTCCLTHAKLPAGSGLQLNRP